MGHRKILLFIAALFLFILSSPSSAAVDEDTVQLSFEKTAQSIAKGAKYTVKKGDYLIGIIKRKYGGSQTENQNILKKVRHLNPAIKNVNLIYPGQLVVFPGEITEEMVSEKEDETATSVYIIKKGDSIIKIVSSQLRISLEESRNMLKTVRRLNPGISNLNMIYPGQKIIIPSKSSEGKTAAEIVPQKKMLEERFLSHENQLSILRYLLSRTGGTMISEGSFYIPLSPQGQIGVNCSEVPVVELADGKTVLLDLSNNIPNNVKKIVETTWKNYSIISSTGEGKSVLEELLHTSDIYTLTKKGGYVSLRNDNLVSLFAGWIVRWEGGAVPYALCINFTDGDSPVVPGNIRQYAMKNGFDLIEVSADAVMTDSYMPYQSMNVASLQWSSKRELVESLLSKMGYSFSKDSSVGIFTIEDDGFNLSIKADLMVETEEGDTIFNFEKLPEQFSDILMKRGLRVFYLSVEEEKGKIIKSVLSALGRSFASDTYRFPLTAAGGHKVCEISFRALKIENGGPSIYLVENEIDGDIYGLLNGKWRVELLRY
jgi:LysM repeat protein